MRRIDELQLYRGKDYCLDNGIIIRCPKLGEVCDYGEKEYLGMISTFTATAIDRCAMLDDMNIDYTTINDFQLFTLFTDGITPDKNDTLNITTRILFGDLDFSKFKPVNDNGELCLINPQGIKLNKDTFYEMAAYIRQMHGIPQPMYTKVTDAFAKKQLITDARNDAEFQRKLIAIKGEHSQFQPYISALVNHPYFKYNWHTVWDISIHAFFDSLKRISIIQNADHLYQGLYSGCIEYSKVKKDLDWLRNIN